MYSGILRTSLSWVSDEDDLANISMSVKHMFVAHNVIIITAGQQTVMSSSDSVHWLVCRSRFNTTSWWAWSI